MPEERDIYQKIQKKRIYLNNQQFSDRTLQNCRILLLVVSTDVEVYLGLVDTQNTIFKAKILEERKYCRKLLDTQKLP